MTQERTVVDPHATSCESRQRATGPDDSIKFLRGLPTFIDIFIDGTCEIDKLAEWVDIQRNLVRSLRTDLRIHAIASKIGDKEHVQVPGGSTNGRFICYRT